MSRGYDRAPTTFSPEGKLVQIEYAFQAVKKNQTLTSVCLRGNDSVVAVIQKKVPDKLMDKDYVTSIYNITPNIGLLVTGIAPDGRAMVYQAREIASKFKDKNGYEIPVHYLANKVANGVQVYTQHLGKRLFGISSTFFSIDDEQGPSLFSVDPAGFFCGYKACAAGTKDQEAQNALEKILKKKNLTLTKTETVHQAIGCLQSVLGMEFKPTDIEVAIVSKESLGVMRLTEKEIDEHLHAISEK